MQRNALEELLPECYHSLEINAPEPAIRSWFTRAIAAVEVALSSSISIGKNLVEDEDALVRVGRIVASWPPSPQRAYLSTKLGQL